MTRTEQTLHKTILSGGRNRRHVAWASVAELKSAIARYAADHGISELAVVAA